MEKLLAKWELTCASSGVLRFLDINLRGVGQVMFQNNPLTGVLFLAAVAWGSYAAGVPQVFDWRAARSGRRRPWLRNGCASTKRLLASGLYGYNAYPRRPRAADLPGLIASAVDLCRAGWRPSLSSPSSEPPMC